MVLREAQGRQDHKDQQGLPARQVEPGRRAQQVEQGRRAQPAQQEQLVNLLGLSISINRQLLWLIRHPETFESIMLHLPA